MRVMLVGSGGREHALALALHNSPSVRFLMVTPANPGISGVTRVASVAADDIPGLVSLAQLERIDLVVVGPEVALAAGLADALALRGIACFGPTRAAAQLESSKAFTKTLCEAKNIPTARFAAFDNTEAALAHLTKVRPPYVIKADGLAAGKGVVIAQTLQEARETIQEMADGRFGPAGNRLVIEEFMTGEEVSFFALCDGHKAIYFGSAQDHKRAFDGERGPNTGGMGAYSPTRHATPAFIDDIMTRFIEPTVAAMAQLGTPFCGVLYAGLMLTPTGPKLVEYNARFGDPECQVLMARFEGDLAAILMACARGQIDTAPSFKLSEQTAALVVLAAQGYPEDPITGSEIRGEAGASAIPNGVLLHAGTRRDGDGKLRSAGGRVLNAIGVGPDLASAVETAYRVVDAIVWPMGFHRRDIGWRELHPELKA
ncbi:phosphoribosylamine-glycine ligase [Candidatus Phycosocius bacilliformis]|uniref:Phosphoribosylamine--glycine ligase n=1 Tax=Candidatus Phycosocius bacilliformis TaxID=1445552 RepID=A0A2P2EBQ9_9PROT|nr:phosphoribosylamine--glycine ligase [Candidatus Phycosocius bacilliformis]GBF58483.1 phosphoribosylamine-glycine ligase [Candidatus Phycosocius bacilliformis]